MTDILKGATDVTRYVMLVDSATGAPETGLVITTLDLQYTRNQSTPAAKVDAVALAATNTAHTDNRAIEVDATSSPGLYRVDWPDAAFATGADKVLLVVTCTGVAPAVELIDLVNFNSQDGVRLGLTALPPANADAAGGLPISDAGGLDLDAIKTDTAAILVDTGTTLDGRIPAALVSGRMDASVGAMSAAAVQAIWDALTSALTTVGSIGKWIVDKLDVAVSTRGTGTSTLSSGDVQTAAAAALTAYDPPTRAEATSDANSILTAVGDVPTNAELTTALNTLLTTAMTESYSADGATMTPAQALYELRALASEFSISGTTMTVKKADGSTTAFTLTLDSSTAPTSITRAT
jgi:hypothetical protein